MMTLSLLLLQFSVFIIVFSFWQPGVTYHGMSAGVKYDKRWKSNGSLQPGSLPNTPLSYKDPICIWGEQR